MLNSSILGVLYSNPLALHICVMWQCDFVLNWEDKYFGNVWPELCSSVQADHETHNILAEAVAHEENCILSNVGHQSWGSAMIQTTYAHLLWDGHKAVHKATVHPGKRLHLHLGCIKGLATQHTCYTTLSKRRRKSRTSDMTKICIWIVIPHFDHVCTTAY